jgi:hypothetical protein
MMTQVNHDKTKPDIKKDKIPRHPKIYVPRSQQRRTYPKSYHQRVPEKIHLGWIDSFSMHQYCSRLRLSYHLVSSTLSNR